MRACSVRRLFLLPALLLLLTPAGCILVPRDAPGRGHGPPPHAPAHGHRAHAHGVEVVFDTGLGVYGVVGWPGVYYHDDRFYRNVDGFWEAGPELRGPWARVKRKALPPGLRKSKGPPGHGRGRGPD